MECLKVRIPDGYIVATVSCDPDYPGIDVEFLHDRDCGIYPSRPRVLFEFSKEDKELRALVWANKLSEDYTKEVVFEMSK